MRSSNAARVRVNLRYAITHLERRPDVLDDRMALVSGALPDVPTAASRSRRRATAGWSRCTPTTRSMPPLDEDGLWAFTTTVVNPELAPLLHSRPLLHPPRGYRFPDSRRRYVEELADLPSGYAPIGDSICSFDPPFAQGMSVAALEAVELRDALACGVDAVRTDFPSQQPESSTGPGPR